MNVLKFFLLFLTRHCFSYLYIVLVSFPEQTQLNELEDSSKNDMMEPIYVNVNGRKQSSPVKLDDLHAYILKNKENNCDGFRKEFEVHVI